MASSFCLETSHTNGTGTFIWLKRAIFANLRIRTSHSSELDSSARHVVWAVAKSFSVRRCNVLSPASQASPLVTHRSSAGQPSRELASLLLADAQLLTVPDDGRIHPTPASSRFGKKCLSFHALLRLITKTRLFPVSLLQTSIFDSRYLQVFRFLSFLKLIWHTEEMPP
jgi:hypothetical protein